MFRGVPAIGREPIPSDDYFYSYRKAISEKLFREEYFQRDGSYR